MSSTAAKTTTDATIDAATTAVTEEIGKPWYFLWAYDERARPLWPGVLSYAL